MENFQYSPSKKSLSIIAKFSIWDPGYITGEQEAVPPYLVILIIENNSLSAKKS